MMMRVMRRATGHGPVRRAARPRMVRTAMTEAVARRNKDFLHADAEAKEKGAAWAVNVCAVVERTPVVMRDMEDWEQVYAEAKFQLRAMRARAYPSGFWSTERGGDDGDSSGAAGDADAGDTIGGFTLAPRVTPDDESKNMQSLNRRLPEYLFLCLLYTSPSPRDS